MLGIIAQKLNFLVIFQSIRANCPLLIHLENLIFEIFADLYIQKLIFWKWRMVFKVLVSQINLIAVHNSMRIYNILYITKKKMAGPINAM